MQLDAYIRVSQVRGREGDSFISPDVQREQISAFARVMGAEIAQWHEDFDQSGGTLNRPGLNAALERIDQGVTGGLIVAKIDRFARAAEAGAVVRRIIDRGGVFASAAERLDPTTPMGKAMLQIMLVFAEMELDRMREGWATAQERAVARGIHVSSTAPTGYLRDDDRRLVADALHAAAVAEAFRLRAAGKSWRTLAAHLNAHRVPSPYGVTNWHTGSVQHIIRNRAYLGEARSGRFTNANAHAPIIDRATFEAAQLVRGPNVARSGDPALLAGLLRCASCRYAMKPDRQTLRNGERVRTYRCRGEHSGGKCTGRAFALASVIEPHVERLFFDAVGTLEAQPTVSSTEVEAAMVVLDDAEAALTAFRDDDRIIGLLGRDGFVEGLEHRVQAVVSARAELAEASASVHSGPLPDRATLEGLWPDLSVSQRQHLLGSVLDVVFLRPGRVLPIQQRSLVMLRGEAPDDLPGRGRRTGKLRRFAWPDDAPDDSGMAVA